VRRHAFVANAIARNPVGRRDPFRQEAAAEPKLPLSAARSAHQDPLSLDPPVVRDV
jgi:hypothetical protein